MHSKKTGIKIKLMFVSVLLSLGMSSVFLWLVMDNAKKWNREQNLEDMYNRLSIATTNLEKDYTQIWSFMSSFSNNHQVDQFLSMTQSELNSRFFYQQDSTAGHLMTKTYDEIANMIMQYGISDMVAKCVVTSNSHDSSLLAGRIYGHSTDAERLQAMFTDKEQHIGGIEVCPFFYAYQSRVRYVIPLHAPIYAYHGAKYIGDVYVALDSEWLESQFSLYTKEQELLVSVNQRVYSYQDQEFTEVTDSFAELFYTNQASKMDDIKPVQKGEEEYVIVQGEGGVFSFAQKLPDYTISLGEDGINQELLYCFAVMLGMIAILYFFLNYMIKRPVTTICNQLQQIAQGNFSELEKLESGDEFQMISEEIIRMSGELKKLMEKTVEDEKVKQNYQFQMLQYQINPHFMYNTLNSIRWMGEINGIPGIVDMTTAFAKILRKTFQNHSDFVTLKEELEFIEEYSRLQAYRYGNAFEIQYEVEEALYHAKVIKFTLEPLIENAVFHGVEASHSKCVIRVGAKQEQNDLILFVWDNGVGIEEENLKKLNDFKARKQDRISGIGMINVHERIQIEFGPSYARQTHE